MSETDRDPALAPLARQAVLDAIVWREDEADGRGVRELAEDVVFARTIATLEQKSPASFAKRKTVAMCADEASPTQQNQSDKFKAPDREVDEDEDETRWDERLAKVAAHKPGPGKPE